MHVGFRRPGAFWIAAYSMKASKAATSMVYHVGKAPEHGAGQVVHTHICSTPLFTKFNRLSILVANSLFFSEFAASSNLWNKRCLPPRTVDMRALRVAN